MQTLSKINPNCRVRLIRERLFSLSCMFSSAVITTRHDYVCDLGGHETTQVLTVLDSVAHRTGSNGERGQIDDLDIFQMQLIGPFASEIGSEMGARSYHQIDQRKQLGSVFPTHDRSRTIGIEILGAGDEAQTNLFALLGISAIKRFYRVDSVGSTKIQLKAACFDHLGFAHRSNDHLMTAFGIEHSKSFVRRIAGSQKENLVETEFFANRISYMQVADMGWIESPPEQSDFFHSLISD